MPCRSILPHPPRVPTTLEPIIRRCCGLAMRRSERSWAPYRCKDCGTQTQAQRTTRHATRNMHNKRRRRVPLRFVELGVRGGIPRRLLTVCWECTLRLLTAPPHSLHCASPPSAAARATSALAAPGLGSPRPTSAPGLASSSAQLAVEGPCHAGWGCAKTTTATADAGTAQAARTQQ